MALLAKLMISSEDVAVAVLSRGASATVTGLLSRMSSMLGSGGRGGCGACRLFGHASHAATPALPCLPVLLRRLSRYAKPQAQGHLLCVVGLARN